MINAFRYLCLFAITVSAHWSFARCGGCIIGVYPETGVISESPVFVLNAGLRAVDIGLAQQESPFYLSSASGVTDLNVLEVKHGMLEVVQFVLAPASPLKTGERYTLMIRSGSGIADKFENGSQTIDDCRYEPVSWTVSEDTCGAPDLLNAAYKDSDYALYGCGPSAGSRYKLGIKDCSNAVAFVELTDKSQDTTYSFYLSIDELGHVNIGHGMCGGAFAFHAEHEYTVRFTLMDFKGRRSKPTDWMNFKNPMPKI